MSFDPVQRFLGATADAEPLDLLGLREARTQLDVEEALRRRLADLYNHPDGRSEDAETARQVLREAAARLKAQLAELAPRTAPKRSTPSPQLTPFDRTVLAILIGSGGWNAISRARLVALAAAHGVSGDGLFRVIAGLAGYAKRSRFDVRRVTAHPRPVLSSSVASPSIPMPDVNSGEEQEGHGWRTFWLSLLFGSVATVLSIAVISQLAPKIERRTGTDQAALAPIEHGPPPTLPEQPAAADAAASEEDDIQLVDWGILRFGPDRLTTFHAPIPNEAVEASRSSETAISDLEGVISRINIAASQRGDHLAVTQQHIWDEVIDQVGSAWPLLEESQLRSIERMMIEALFSSAGIAESDTYERLLKALDPPSTVRDFEPLDLWRGAWRTGMLARIAFHPDLPTGIVESGQARLNVALDRRAGDDAWLSFTQAAAAWLDLTEPAIFAKLSDEHQAFTLWELWIAAHKRLGTREQINHALLGSVRAILASNQQLLTEEGTGTPALAVLGRLLDEADFQRSSRARQQFLALLEDDQVPPEKIWVLTSLLAHSMQVAWFGESLVLRNSDPKVRNRLRQDIDAAWPSEAVAAAPGATLGREELDEQALETLQRWVRDVERLEQEQIEVHDQEALLRQIVQLARAGEAAAYLVARMTVRAERLLDKIQQGEDLSARQGKAPSEQRAGRPTGSEGGWATAYEESKSSAAERTALLRALRASAGGDLWPRDAATVVYEAYRGSPNEIRSIAQGVVLDAFRKGPMVAQELLDQLVDVHRTAAISDFLSSYTGVSLPPQRDQGWMIAARLALVEHLLGLLSDGSPELELRVDELAESYAGAVRALEGAEGEAIHSIGSVEAEAAATFDLWHTRAQAYAASRLGQELARIDQRHSARMSLAEGPIQRTVALRIGTLELMAAETRGKALASSSQLGGLDLRMSHLIERYQEQWQAAPGVLLQALWVERAINAVWRVRLDPSEGLASTDSQYAAPPRLAPMAAHMFWLITSPTQLAIDTENPWNDRLEALEPSQPLAYFELAEEIADVERSRQMVALAKHLFALAGALDPERLGRSSCLALADLEEQPHHKRQFLALAELLARRRSNSSIATTDAEAPDTPERRAAALALAEGLSHYRRGNGSRAAQIMRRDEVLLLMQSVESALPRRSVDAFLKEVEAERRRPKIDKATLIRLVQVEQFLLGAEPAGSAAWATELTFTGGQPLIEVDPTRLDQALGADTARPFWRGGAWRETPE